MNENRICADCVYFDNCGDLDRFRPCKGKVTKRDKKIETIEDMILTMADIIHENRQLKYELEQARYDAMLDKEKMNALYECANNTTNSIIKAFINGDIDKVNK